MCDNQGVVICLACGHPKDTLVWVGLAICSTNRLVHPVASLWAVTGLNGRALASMSHHQRLVAILASSNLQDAQVGVGLSIRSANRIVLSGAVLGAFCSHFAFTLMCDNQGVVICLACGHPKDTLVWVGLAICSTNRLVHPVASLWAVTGLNGRALASMSHHQRLVAILASSNLQDAQVGVGLSIRSTHRLVLAGAMLGALSSNLTFTFMSHNQCVIVCFARSHPEDTLV